MVQAAWSLDARPGLARAAVAVLLLEVVGYGVFGLLYFWEDVLPFRGFRDLSLPLVALVAGIASTFNPCALPALPAFVAATSSAGEQVPRRERLRLSAAAGAGAAAVVALLGLLVAAAGSRTGDLVGERFRWVPLAVGILLIVVAALHLAGRTSRFPMVRSATALGSRVWDAVAGSRSTGSSFGWGAGFVAIGAG